MGDGVVVSLTFKVNYWTVVNQSTASINLKAEEIIFENKDSVVPLPSGFVLSNETEETSPSARPEFLEPLTLPAKRLRFEHASSSSFKPVSKDAEGEGGITLHGLPDVFPTCEGCKNDSHNQKAHMNPGGCLYEEE
jgi:hypothetical protein